MQRRRGRRQRRRNQVRPRRVAEQPQEMEVEQENVQGEGAGQEPPTQFNFIRPIFIPDEEDHEETSSSSDGEDVAGNNIAGGEAGGPPAAPRPAVQPQVANPDMPRVGNPLNNPQVPAAAPQGDGPRVLQQGIVAPQGPANLQRMQCLRVLVFGNHVLPLQAPREGAAPIRAPEIPEDPVQLDANLRRLIREIGMALRSRIARNHPYLIRCTHFFMSIWTTADGHSDFRCLTCFEREPRPGRRQKNVHKISLTGGVQQTACPECGLRPDTYVSTECTSCSYVGFNNEERISAGEEVSSCILG